MKHKNGGSFSKVMFVSLNFNCTCDISCAQSEFVTVDHEDCATTHNSCMHYQSNSSNLHIFEMDKQEVFIVGWPKDSNKNT